MSALELEAFCVIRLRLTKDAYLDLTPRETHAYIVEYWREQDMLNLRSSVIAAEVRNTRPRPKGAKMTTPHDIFAPISTSIKRRPSRTREETLEAWRRSHKDFEAGLFNRR